MSVVSVRQLDITAFRRFRGRVTVDVGQTGLHFVRGVNECNARLGANGVGKSTLWDALTWCLYGKTVKGRPTTSVRPWQSKLVPCVAVTLDVDGTTHIVERRARSSGLTIDGETVGQEDVEHLVGLDHTLFTQAIVLGQERPLFFDLPPASKMQILSSVLGLDRWEVRSATAANRAATLQARVDRMLSEQQGLAVTMEAAERTLAQAQAAAERWGAERAQATETAREELAAARARLEDLQAHLDRASVDADEAGTQAKLSRPSVVRLRDEQAGARTSAAEARSHASRAEGEISALDRQIASLRDGGTCPFCGQTVGKKDAALHLAELLTERAALQEERALALAQTAEHEEAARALAAKLQGEEARLEELEEAERAHGLTVARLERQLGEVHGRVSALASREAELSGEVNPHREAAKQARAQVARTQQRMDELGEDIARYERSVYRAKWWVQGFKDIRLMVIEDVLTELRETTHIMLEELGLGDWEVMYATERETKSGTQQRALVVSVESPDSGGPQHWEDWSGGESQRLRLAGALALSEALLGHAGVQFDLRVLDEPTRGMSAEGVRDLCELLATYAEEANLSIWYVDHMAVALESAGAASTITVTSTPSGSVVDAQPATTRR